MSQPFLKPYNTTIPVDGKLETIEAYVVLDQNGVILSGPHDDVEVAKRELAALKGAADIEAFLVSKGIDPDNRSFKGKRKFLLEYLAFLETKKSVPVSQPTEAPADGGDSKPVPEGAPGPDEKVLDEKDEF